MFHITKKNPNLNTHTEIIPHGNYNTFINVRTDKIASRVHLGLDKSKKDDDWLQDYDFPTIWGKLMRIQTIIARPGLGAVSWQDLQMLRNFSAEVGEGLPGSDVQLLTSFFQKYCKCCIEKV